MKTALTYFIIVYTIISGASQDIFGKRILGTEDGLLSREVFMMAECNHNRKWIATANGLQIYDGHQLLGLEDFGIKDVIGRQLVASVNFFEDSLMYISVRNGLYVINTNTFTLKNVTIPKINKEEYITHTRYKNEDYFIKVGFSRAYIIKGSNNKYTILDQLKLRREVGSGFNIHIDDEKLIWSSASIGLRVLNRATGELIAEEFQEGKNYPCFIANDGSIYVMENLVHLHKYTSAYHQSKKLITLENFSGSGLKVTSNGSLWILGDDLIKINDGEIHTIEKKFRNSFLLKRFNHLLEDDEGNIWISSIDGIGLSYSTKKRFKHYWKSIDGFNECRGLFVKDKSLFILPQTVPGYYLKIDLETGKEETIKIRDEDGNHLIEWKSIFPTLLDKLTGKNWVSSNSYGLGLLDFSTGIFEKKLDIPMGPFSFISNDNLILGSKLENIVIYNFSNDSSSHLHLDSLGTVHANQYLVSSDSTIYIPSYNGIYKINLDGEIIASITTETEPALPNNDIRMLVSDGHNGFYGASKGGGLIHLNSELNEVTTYGVEAGFKNLEMSFLHKLDHENLLVATFHGLSLFNLNTYRASNFYEEDGLSHNEFNTNSYHFINDDLFLGTLNGVTQISRENIKAPSNRPKIHISNISRSRKNGTIDYWFNIPDKIYLNPDDRWLKIEVFLSDYYKSDEHTFLYKFENEGTEWYRVENNNRILFEDLKPGKYKLKIKGYDIYNTESDGELEVNIIQDEEFIKSNLFFFLLASTLFLIAYTFYRRIKNENIRLEKVVQERTSELQNDKELIQKQAAELKKLDKDKTEFFRNVIHELKTPLTLISAPLEMLKESKKMSQENNKLINIIEKNTNLLLARMQQLVLVGKDSFEPLSIESEIFDLGDLLEKSLSIFYFEAEKKGVSLQINDNLGNIYVQSDQPKIQSILQNIVSNAVKYCKNPGVVKIDLDYFEEELRIRVFNNSSKIPKQKLDKIFLPYFSLEDSEGKSSGVGLTVAKNFAKLLNGDINVDSSDEGTTFNIVLPIVRVEANQRKFDNNENYFFSESTTYSHRYNMIIVEDNIDLANVLALLFDPYFNCLIFSDGSLGYQYIVSNPSKVDLILSDIMMPVLDGISMVKRLRKHKDFQNLPVIFLTADETVFSRTEASNLGIEDYIKKPFKKSELYARVKSIMDKYSVRILSPYEDKNDEEAIKFKQDIESIIKDNMSSPTFSTSFIAESLQISNRTLIRHSKKYIGLLPREVIKEVKLLEARKILVSKVSDIDDAMMATGYIDKKYFKQQYFERFGNDPES